MGFYEFLKIIKYLLSHPLVISLILFYLGLKFGFNKFIDAQRAARISEIKDEVIRDILSIQRKAIQFKFYYQRLIRTIKKAEEEKRKIKKTFIKKEIDNMSQIINGDIPLLDSNLEAKLKFYFQNSSEIMSAFESFHEKVKKFNDFAVNELFRKEISELMSKEEFKELKLDKIEKSSKELSSLIQKEKTIWHS